MTLMLPLVKSQRQLNEPSRRAWEQADEQTIAAYQRVGAAD